MREALAAGLLLAVLVALLPPQSAEAQVRLTQQEALRIAFPEPAAIERRTAFLSEEQRERASRLAGPKVPVEQEVITYYVGTRDGRVLGYAYFDAHRVRTLPEVIMVTVAPEGTVRRIEVLKFAEPPEYLPPERWLRQFHGRELDEGLSRKGEIVNLTGATLTARAVTRAVRRTLALHDVIAGGDA